MPISFTVSSYQRYSPDQESERTFEAPSFRIGREPDNDWVLPDPERTLSRHHCTIEKRGDAYVLLDTSSNGVYVNGSETPVGRGNRVTLNDGDIVALGDYELRVGIIPNDGALPPPAPREEPPILTEEYDLSMFSAPQSPASKDSAPPVAKPTGGGNIDEFFEPPKPSEPIIPADWDLPPEEAGSQSPGVSDNDLGSDQPAERPAATKPERSRKGNERRYDIGEEIAAEDAPLSALETVVSADGLVESKSESAAAAGAALKAFLRGAGLSGLEIPETEVATLMERQGQLFRELVAGLMLELAGRRDIKDEFRLGQTQIRRTVNNPLKFLPTPDEAVKTLLIGGGPAYMDSLDAVREGFRDLNAHQMAVIAGTRASYRQLLERFEPGALEERFGSHAGLGGLLPATRKGRYWDLFKELYAQIKEDSEDNFDDLLGREFARAYEEQIRKLSG